MESRPLPLILGAVLLLARAEAGGLDIGRRAANGNQIDPPLPPARTLKPIQAEITRWGYPTGVKEILTLLLKAGLLQSNGAAKLVPTATAFTWLQVPPALALRLLAEASGIFPAGDLVERLRRGIKPEELSPAARKAVELLALFGLVDRWQGLLYAGDPATVRLLILAGAIPDGLLPEDPSQLELAAAWSARYPGNYPSKNWLTWDETVSSFSFSRPEDAYTLPFNPWQLFRLLALCRITGGSPEQLWLSPTPEAVLEASRRGWGYKEILEQLTAGLDHSPTLLARTVKKWLGKSGRYRLLNGPVLEAENREAMAQILSDRAIRPYVSRPISPRHALLAPRDINRLSGLLKRRDHSLFIPPELDRNIPNRGQILALERKQIQLLLAALTVYRRDRLELEGETGQLDSLGILLENCLTLAELKEAYRQAEDLPPPRPLTVKTEFPAFEEPELAEVVLEHAIEKELEVLIEYSTPGKGSRQRWIEPLFLEEKDGFKYLTAYCRLRREVRIFRLDRLKVLEKKGL